MTTEIDIPRRSFFSVFTGGIIQKYWPTYLILFSFNKNAINYSACFKYYDRIITRIEDDQG